MQKKLILFDIDGTIFDNAKQIVHQSTYYTLEQLYKNGHELAIATGRAHVSLHHIANVLPFFKHYILINGQQVVSNKKLIYASTLPTSTLRNLLVSFEEHHLQYGFRSAYDEKLNQLSDLDNMQKDSVDIYQIWCYGKKDEIEKLKLIHDDFEFLAWGNIGYDVVKKGRSKAQAIKILSDYLKIPMEDTIAIGDANNDILMLQTVNLGIAMGNAINEVKEVSKYVTTAIGDDGVYNAFLHFGLIPEMK